MSNYVAIDGKTSRRAYGRDGKALHLVSAWAAQQRLVLGQEPCGEKENEITAIPAKANRKLPAEFDAEIYRERNKIERFFGRLKASFRRLATRYEKTSSNFLAMIKLASIRIWCQFYESAA